MASKFLAYIAIAEEILQHDQQVKGAKPGDVITVPPIKGVRLHGKKVKINVAIEVEA